MRAILKRRTQRGGGRRPGASAFTRYCHYQYCMVYSIQKGSRGGGIYCAEIRAIVLQSFEQCRCVGGK